MPHMDLRAVSGRAHRDHRDLLDARHAELHEARDGLRGGAVSAVRRRLDAHPPAGTFTASIDAADSRLAATAERVPA